MPELNYSAWQFWVNSAVLIGMAANLTYTWWTNREKITSKRFRALEDAVAEKITSAQARELISQHEPGCPNVNRTIEAEKSLQRIGGEVRSLPSRLEIHQLDHTLSALGGKLSKLEGRLDSVDRILNLMNEFLINQGGKR
jgi:hypothetical protein